MKKIAVFLGLMLMATVLMSQAVIPKVHSFTPSLDVYSITIVQDGPNSKIPLELGSHLTINGNKVELFLDANGRYIKKTFSIVNITVINDILTHYVFKEENGNICAMAIRSDGAILWMLANGAQMILIYNRHNGKEVELLAAPPFREGKS